MLTKNEPLIDLNAFKIAKEKQSLEALVYTEKTTPINLIYDDLIKMATEADKVVCPTEKKTKDIF